MKKLIPVALATSVLSIAIAANVSAAGLPAGQVDFGTFTPSSSGGKFVEVHVTSSLISMAARLLEKEEPDVAALLNGLQLVHVNVVGLDDANRAEVERRVEKVRRELDGSGWQKVVAARQQDQDVGVYLKTRNKDSVLGLVVTVVEANKQAVFINIVGDIKPEKLSVIGERLHIDPLKHLGNVSGK
jgi:Skp family chaperone for outer membrane proteins